MRARTRHETAPFGAALVALLLGIAFAVSGCAWGSSASEGTSPAPSESAADDAGDDTDNDNPETNGPIAVGSPIVTPTALEAAGNPLGFVRDLLDTWAEENCDDPDCLFYEVDPEDATDECTYVGSDPGPGVEVDEGSTVVLFADCDEVTDPDEPDPAEPDPDVSTSDDPDGGT